MSTAPPVTEIPEGDSTTSVRIPTRQRVGSRRWKATAYSLLGARRDDRHLAASLKVSRRAG